MNARRPGSPAGDVHAPREDAGGDVSFRRMSPEAAWNAGVDAIPSRIRAEGASEALRNAWRQGTNRGTRGTRRKGHPKHSATPGGGVRNGVLEGPDGRGTRHILRNPRGRCRRDPGQSGGGRGARRDTLARGRRPVWWSRPVSHIGDPSGAGAAGPPMPKESGPPFRPTRALRDRRSGPPTPPRQSGSPPAAGYPVFNARIPAGAPGRRAPAVPPRGAGPSVDCPAH